MNKSRRDFIKKIGVGSLAVSSVGLPLAAKNTNKKPNIIFILADDLGYGDLGCYNGKKIETPHIDRLASEGMQFTQFYAGSAVCTPTRVSCMTGKYPIRFNISHHFDDREMHLPTGVVTLPKLLNKAGYNTKHIGKWHLGGLNKEHTENRDISIPGPLEHGFDEYLAMYEDPAIRLPLMLNDKLYKDGAKNLVSNDQPVPKSDLHWTDYKVKESLEFIEGKSAENSPFYLNLWFDAPHAPYEPASGESLEMYKSRAKNDDLYYRSMVTNLDKGVGEIVQKLKDLEIDKNTLIIFSSDNGPSHQGSPGPLKGRKGDLHEGGIRVPMIAWWPGKIPKQSTSDALTHTNDLLPTFCKIANQSVPINAEIDGENILPVLTGENHNFNNRTLFWQIDLYKSNYDVVQEEKPKPYATEIVRQGKWKLLAKNGKAVELFNMNEDPYERWNLLNIWPRISDKLSKRLNIWLSEPRAPKEIAGIPEEKTEISHVSHFAKNCKIEQVNSAETKHAKDGMNALVDGIRATSSFSDGYWVGVEKDNLELVIDLGKTQKVSEVSIGCLHEPRKWIFFPKEILFSLSNDKNKILMSKKISCKSEKNLSLIIEKFTKRIKPKNCRYVKFNIKNIKVCPQNHVGAGKPAWMFLDEIIVK